MLVDFPCDKWLAYTALVVPQTHLQSHMLLPRSPFGARLITVQKPKVRCPIVSSVYIGGLPTFGILKFL